MKKDKQIDIKESDSEIIMYIQAIMTTPNNEYVCETCIE